MSFIFESNDQVFISLDTGVSGMNQTAIARMSGVSQQAVSSLINNAMQNKSNFSELFNLFGKKESDLVICDHQYQKVYNSIVCHAVISYYASEKRPEAIKALISLGRIGITAFIQDLTKFKMHQGSDADIEALQRQIDVLKEIKRRQEHKIDSLEFYVTNQASPLLQDLTKIMGSAEYFNDLSVLAPQIQRNVFKAMYMIKNAFWFIYKARKDTGVESLLQLSRDKIKAVVASAPADIIAKKGLPGKGHIVKDKEWSDLFQMDFDYLYEQTELYQSRDRFTVFGERRDLIDINDSIRRDKEELEHERIIYRLCKSIVAGYPQDFKVRDIFAVMLEHRIISTQVTDRLIRHCPDTCQKVLEAIEHYEQSKKWLNCLKSTSRAMLEPSTSIDARLTAYWEANLYIACVCNNDLDVNSGDFNFKTEAWVYPQFTHFSKPKREHFFLPELKDLIDECVVLHNKKFLADLKILRRDPEIDEYCLEWFTKDIESRVQHGLKTAFKSYRTN
ncbi:hypothetical protein 2AV2_84 [Nodularia phage vB_NpeS-2AV2]|jgi:hypothetical protein|uniref:HTH cro/C1-type domain-containing protein n=3 Tax=Ravarandavirus TaxID=2843444 RepID=A0A482MK55_9CAUD|nr:hypothetical protein HWA92_gp084 [Nodularia phage vB_NpeS-2AV2]YP_009844908.1 hypothetical protein HWC13_gp099 [Nodularia phage vB_NspS-kac68v161]ALY07536.1 hypothetical protein 2AV2_84 [Nodularia phage vB_NpeS-2AV2]QBQ73749.1 hypothetical protein kac68v161_gp099 [Nodularia phage vB_NspS-kac68v161]QBQ73945.1 hypothetical protein kac68v162_gp097 [Nodularia phage vB_NspS-kac68v162]